MAACIFFPRSVKGGIDFGSNASSVVLPNPPVRPDKNNYGPRAGLAYRLTNNTTIRSGFGVFYAYTGGGAALGNMIRGVPLDATGFFAIPLFTDFQPGMQPGIFDWYTTLVGVFTLCVLAGHGALYLVWRTTGRVQGRGAAWARKIGPGPPAAPLNG